MKQITIDRSKRLYEEPHTGHNRWHPDIEPVLEVAPGEEVLLETRDAADGQIKPGSKDNLIFDQRMTEYTARPCTVPLEHIRDSDLDLEHNDIPGSVLSLLTKIRDK